MWRVLVCGFRIRMSRDLIVHGVGGVVRCCAEIAFSGGRMWNMLLLTSSS